MKLTPDLRLVAIAGQPVECAQTADFDNYYYVTIGRSLAANFDLANAEVFDIDRAAAVFTFHDCTPVFAKKPSFNINKMGKVRGSMTFRYIVLKYALLCKPELLSHIIDNSIHGSSLPDSLKTGCVVPLPKTGALSDVANWRPICLLNLFSKLIEKFVHKQRITYLIDQPPMLLLI